MGNRVPGSSPPAERAGNKRFRLWFAPLSQSNLIRYALILHNLINNQGILKL